MACSESGQGGDDVLVGVTWMSHRRRKRTMSYLSLIRPTESPIITTNTGTVSSGFGMF